MKMDWMAPGKPPAKPMTQKQAVLKRLETLDPAIWLAVHEFRLNGMSENSIASRLPELAKIGAVQSRLREGKPYKEWSLASVQKELFA